MIFVDGAPISSSSSSSGGFGTLISLLQHPKLVSASNLFKALPERKVSFAEDLGSKSSMQKHVYVFQREYATVDPAVVEFVGTDEATTCVGLVIRNPKTGMTSVAHMDSPAVVDLGVNQMLSFVIDRNSDAELDVHLIGGFDDASPKCNNGMNGSKSYSGSNGHSFPLCSRIVETLQRRSEKCHIQTLCVLDHNTRRDSGGNASPMVNGFLVETCTGSIMPATFDRTSRCPDEIVRRIRVTVSFEDPTWKGKLLETYDTSNGRFQIAACSWLPRWKNIAFSLRQLPDSELLLTCSTSPFAEGPDFVDNERSCMWLATGIHFLNYVPSRAKSVAVLLFDYLIQHPSWRETFPMRKPRIFERTADGDDEQWKMESICVGDPTVQFLRSHWGMTDLDNVKATSFGFYDGSSIVVPPIGSASGNDSHGTYSGFFNEENDHIIPHDAFHIDVEAKIHNEPEPEKKCVICVQQIVPLYGATLIMVQGSGFSFNGYCVHLYIIIIIIIIVYQFFDAGEMSSFHLSETNHFEFEYDRGV